MGWFVSMLIRIMIWSELFLKCSLAPKN